MTATLDTLPLVRRITEQAYKAGASLVTTLLSDEESQLLRYRYAPNESFDYAASWLYGESRMPFAGARRGWRLPAGIRRCFRRKIRRR